MSERPHRCRTWAPRGQTPVLQYHFNWKMLSAMAWVTWWNFYFRLFPGTIRSPQVIEFLVHLGHEAGDRLLVIWDGSPIHRRAEVTEFVSGTRGKVWLEALPGYAPDLNPWDEGGWHRLKNVEMRNLVCRDLDELHQELDLAVGRLRQKPHLVRSFFAQAGLKLRGT